MASIFASVHIDKDSRIEARWITDSTGGYLLMNLENCTLFISADAVEKVREALLNGAAAGKLTSSEPQA